MIQKDFGYNPDIKPGFENCKPGPTICVVHGSTTIILRHYWSGSGHCSRYRVVEIHSREGVERPDGWYIGRMVRSDHISDYGGIGSRIKEQIESIPFHLRWPVHGQTEGFTGNEPY